LYKSATDNVGTETTVDAAIALIRSGKYQKQITALRKVTDPDANAALKKKLPAVTWSGTFTKRSAKGLDTYSQIICVDIDKLLPDQLLSLSDRLTRDPYVLFMFTSPNGNGLKVLFITTGTADYHAQLFADLQQYFLSRYDVQIDKACKDVSRLCFLSAHADAYLNESAELFALESKVHVLDPSVLPSDVYRLDPIDIDPQPMPQITSADIMQQLYDFTNRKQTFTPGNKNNFIHLYACNANRHGVFADDVTAFFSARGTADKLTTDTIRNAYTRNSAEHGRYRDASLTQTRRHKGAPATGNHQPSSDSGIDDSILFWEWKETGKTRPVTNDQGEVIKLQPVMRVQYSFDNMIAFLCNNGFYRYALEEGSSVLIRVRDNVVKVVDTENISDFVLAYLESRPDEFKMIRELFRQKIGTYMDIKQLKQLPILPYKIKKLDDAHTGFVYFRNCYLRVTGITCTSHPYTELRDGHIWERQRIDYDYTDPGAEYMSVVEEFFLCSILGRKVTDGETLPEIDAKKMKAVRTAIGYLIHRYKNPTVTKAVVASDRELRTGNKSNANGRTGKSLTGKILSKFINVCMIEGKMFKFDAPRPFEKLNPDHAMINFNDVRKNFDFEGLFGLLTDDFTYNVIYKEAVTLSFDDSPKVYITTNFSLRGQGDSNIGRQHIIEFSNFFTATHQPSDYFGHMFFYDWGRPEYQKQWALYYRFMVDCLQEYLAHGLVPFPLENYRLNQFLDQADEVILDWFNDKFYPLENSADYSILDGKRHNKLELYNGFRTEMGHINNHTPHKFTRWLGMYCDIHNIAINAHVTNPNHRGRERTGGIDYVTFTQKK
jgi:hypothetical protein